jgi:gluconokinase
MVSAAGLWDQIRNEYDEETLAAVSVGREQLADVASLDRMERQLLPQYLRMWPAFEGAVWLPPHGDGAANHIGSCPARSAFSLMVGTTGAMRTLLEAPPVELPDGMWRYRLDGARAIAGGALSNGGEVYAWMKRTLVLPKDLEARLDTAVPGSHGLTVLPFLAGERSPYWRADLRGAITGLGLITEPFDIFRAALESVALGFREIYALLTAAGPPPQDVIASGGALLRSPGWTQMMADALGRPVVASTEPEASARGAVLWAMERTGLIANLAEIPASNGAIFSPRPEYAAGWERLFVNRQAVYGRLYGT